MNPGAAAAAARLSAESTRVLEAPGTPPGFDALATAHVTLVDVYFGDRKVGETLVDIRPGVIRFNAPADVLAMLPDVVSTPDLDALLAADLPTNSAALCSLAKSTHCGALAPPVLGVIYDEDRFRVDLFVNPRFLRTVGAPGRALLPVPTTDLSLTSAFAVAASGWVGGQSTYNLQSRTVLGFRNIRVRASGSLASGQGVVADDFTAEIDRKDQRYSAGLLWAPGSDFTGERRIVGAGVGTQFDTQADPATVRGTPLIVYLPQPARVDILVDGRLVSSRAYDAGNQELDTSALSDGSYPVLLRIQEQNGAPREESRFFVRTADIPPLGHPVYFAYAGALANSLPHHVVDPSRTLFYQAGAAWRLTNAVAIDADVLGTRRKTIVEAGAWLLQRAVRIRGAALASTAGDAGLLVQMSSAVGDRLSLSLDLRRIWSGDGGPLIPLPKAVETFDGDQPVGAQLATGSYTQAVGSLGVRLGGGNLSIVGSFQQNSRARSDYSIGPSLDWPVATRNGLQVAFAVSGQRSRSDTAAFAGIRILAAKGRSSLIATVGDNMDRTAAGPGDGGRATGSLSVQYFGAPAAGTVLAGEAGVERDLQSSTLHAGGTASGNFGNARADIFHGIEGNSRTQYDVSVQSGLAVSAHSVSFGASQPEPSAIIVSVDGDAPGALFDVLLDDVTRGQIRTGQHLSLFVAGYRTYRVRIVPANAAAVDVDGTAREVTLYPGNVQALRWTADSYVTVVAQAVSTDGIPVADALVQTQRAVAETDSSGFFQLDLRHGDVTTITKAGARPCVVALPALSVQKGYASAGKVICK